MKSCTEHT